MSSSGNDVASRIRAQSARYHADMSAQNVKDAQTSLANARLAMEEEQRVFITDIRVLIGYISQTADRAPPPNVMDIIGRYIEQLVADTTSRSAQTAEEPQASTVLPNGDSISLDCGGDTFGRLMKI